MANVVLSIGDILQYINNRVSICNEEQIKLNLTNEDLLDRLKSDKKVAADLLEIRMRQESIKGRLEELREMNDSLITQLGKYQLEKQNA